MDWTGLLKHLGISRGIVLAIFITTFTMKFGPEHFESIPATPAPWPAIAFALMILTGILLLIWAVIGIWEFIVRKWHSIFSFVYSKLPMTQLQVELLYRMGQRPSRFLDLDRLPYGNYGGEVLTRLEAIQAIRNLARKGYVKFYSSNNTAFLTPRGEKAALRIERKTRNVSQD